MQVSLRYILYDHYLTREWDLFSRRPLESVTYNFLQGYGKQL